MPTRHNRRHKHPDWKPAFLAALAQTGLVSAAAQHAHISPRTAQHARDLHNRTGNNLLHAQNFARDWDAALEQFSDTLELEIRNRALHGVERQTPIFYKGQQVGTQSVRVYSDRLLMFLAKALRPQRFGPHTNTPDQFRFATPAPEPDHLAEARQRTEQRWAQLVPTILKMFGTQPQPSASETAPDNPSDNPSPSPDNPSHFSDNQSPNPFPQPHAQNGQ